MPSKKLPAFQFYPGDWMKDPALRACSLAARGLWMDILCLMFESDRRGYLIHKNGNPISTEQLARMTGCPVEQTAELMEELITCGVITETQDGVPYSKRMVRDEQKRTLCSEAGKRGGGSPIIATFKGSSKGSLKGSLKGDAKGGVFNEMQLVENDKDSMGDENEELKGCNGNVTPPLKSPPLFPPFSPPLHSPSISPLISPQKFSKKALSIDNAKESQLSLPADFLDGLEMEEPERPKSFKLWSLDDLIQAVGKFPEYADIAGDFIDYWSEQTPSGKMRLHLEKAWDTKRRLRTWADRNRQMPSGSRNRPRERRPGI